MRALGRFGLSLTPSGVFVQGTASSVQPCEVIAAVSGGRTDAKVTVQILNISGLPTGNTFADVLPLPFAEFVQVGDRGIYTSVAVASGTVETFGRFFFGNRERFIRFT
jgi:hypothetical protein